MIAGNAYLVDAARRLTCAGIDEGRAPAVISAIMKAHATFLMRESVIDAMDVHAGKAVIDGPRNYLGSLWRALPIGITVEGANILTRNLIIFGQGAIRCHPWLLKEMTALEEPDADKALQEFDAAFWGHVGHSAATLFRAWGRSWTGGRLAPAPDAGPVRRLYRQISRYAACFALASAMALLTMGGALKRKESISARLGDVLSELYLLSAVLKRWEDDGRHDADLPLVDWCMARGTGRIAAALDDVLANFPSRPAAWLMRFVMPPGTRRGPPDALTHACAEILMETSATRDRLTAGLHFGLEGEPVSNLETAFRLVVESEPLPRRLKEAKVDMAAGLERGIISRTDAQRLAEAESAVAEVVEVDDFAAADLSGAQPKAARGKTARKATTRPKKPVETAATSSAPAVETPARKVARR